MGVACDAVYTWRSEGDLKELFSLARGSQGLSQAVKRGCGYLYLQNHLTTPRRLISNLFLLVLIKFHYQFCGGFIFKLRF